MMIAGFYRRFLSSVLKEGKIDKGEYLWQVIAKTQPSAKNAERNICGKFKIGDTLVARNGNMHIAHIVTRRDRLPLQME